MFIAWKVYKKNATKLIERYFVVPDLLFAKMSHGVIASVVCYEIVMDQAGKRED